ncbi:MAG: protein kinase, partial [Candidatus Riflebacteria bacterium]|nr:protein kinase [Candidatus Riflebacteria bacterium]
MSDFTTNYKVLCELGRGGMGVVYLARQLSLDRLVALKVVLTTEGEEQSFLRRFRREAKVVMELVHPNVVRLLDFELDCGRPYLVFEYVEGRRTVADAFAQTGSGETLVDMMELDLIIGSGGVLSHA